MSRLGLDAGTLVLFDQREKAPPIDERSSRGETEHACRKLTRLCTSGSNESCYTPPQADLLVL